MPWRARFTLAHELSHLILHREHFDGREFRTIDQYKKFLVDIPDEVYAWLEWQARNLGGLILVPKASLKKYFNEAENAARQAKLDPKTEPAIDYMADWVARHFVVSRSVIKNRLAKDGLIIDHKVE